MGNVAVTEWLGRIELEAGEAPAVLIERALRDTLQRFCQESEIWRVDLALIDVASVGQTAFTPKTPEGSRLAGFRHLEFNGAEVRPKGEIWLDRNLSAGWRSETETTPQYYHFPTPGTFRLISAPKEVETGPIYARAYLKPTVSTREVPDWLFEEEDFRLTVEAGAKAVVYRQFGTPWYDLKAADYWDGKFDAGTERARVEAERDQSQAAITLQMPSFGGIGHD